ncbi:BNR-4 repeat-containing protein, partial [Candidatus Margulisiibacteriota bacterium]
MKDTYKSPSIINVGIILLAGFIFINSCVRPYNQKNPEIDILEVVPDILLAEWTFDNNILIDEIGNNSASLHGNATIQDNRLFLNPVGYMLVERDNLSPTGGIKLEADILFNRIGSDFIIENFNKDLKSGYLLRTTSGVRLEFYVGNGEDIAWIQALIQPNIKYNVKAVYTGQCLALYLNDLIQDWKVFEGDILYSSSKNIYIGSHEGTSQFVDGIIDNLRFSESHNLLFSISTAVAPDIIPNSYFEWPLSAVGGVSPYQWSIQGLPDGLRLDNDTGLIWGEIIDLQQNSFTVTVNCRDSSRSDSDSVRVFNINLCRTIENSPVKVVSTRGVYNHATNIGRSTPQLICKNTAKGNDFYAVYQGLELDPEVIFYSAGTGLWSKYFKAGNNYLKSDKHGHPVITMDSEGYLHVFFGANISFIQHSKSRRPEDITEWQTMPDIPSIALYPSVLSFTNSQMMLFYSSQDKKYCFRRSNTNGGSWSVRNEVVYWGPSFYVISDAGISYDESRDEIHFSWSTYDYSTYRHQGVYYAKTTDKGQNWQKADASSLSLPINSTNADVVYYQSDEITYGESITYDNKGQPIILFTTKKDDDANASYKVAYYKSGSWKIYPVLDVDTVNRGGGIFYDDQS